MKKHFSKISTLVVALMATTYTFAAGIAHVQVFHNCADPAADTVSVFVDLGAGQTTLIPSFAFRTATGFVDVPSGASFTVHIKAKGSNAGSPSIYSQVLGPLADDSSYIVVASGVVQSGFATNPNLLSTAFGLKVLAPARRAAANAGKVDFAVFHGVTDAPGVDVNLSNGGGTLVPNAKYGDASGYLSVDPTWYPIDIALAGSATPVAQYVADLSTLSGGAAVVFASGFLIPSANLNGAAFGLFAVLASGTVIQLPTQQNAKVQLVHNCADPAADSVDVYLDGALIKDNFEFRTATSFIPVLAGVNHTVVIAGAYSTSAAQALATFDSINLMANANYTVFASGTVDTGFAANPNGRNIGFDLKILANRQLTATNSAKVDFAVFHGCTDAPGVDVNLKGGATLVPNAKYGDGTGYLSVDPTWYPIDIAAAGTSTVVASYVADLTSLTGGAAIVFASGFLTSSANNNGAAFGLYAVLADGTVIALPALQTALVQVLHNCADIDADSVDVYINSALALDNFAFRTGTPFIPLVAGYPNLVSIAAKSSTSAASPLWSNSYTLNAGEKYILTASGLVGSGYAANPDLKSTAFNVLVKTPAQSSALVSTNFDFYAIHGSTDAPTVDVVANGSLTLVNNASYSDQTGYIPAPAASYTLSVRDSSGANTVVSYSADLTTLAGNSGVVLASGFLNPATNNNGAAFGLYVALPTGGPFIPLSVTTSINDVNQEIGFSMFPNPSNGTLFINFDLQQTERVTVQIADLTGKTVKEVMTNKTVNGKQNIVADLSDLSNGMYVARIITSTKVVNNKFNIVK